MEKCVEKCAKKSEINALELVSASYFSFKVVGFSTATFLESHSNLVILVLQSQDKAPQ